jgi:uncharacterized protein YjbJ (UPF0337 family)
MKKFLALLEELDPTTQGHPKWDLLDFLKSKGINASGVKGTDTIYIDTGEKNIAITVTNTEEDAESIEAGYGDYNVNDEVENLAGKAQGGLKGMAGKVFGSAAQQAAGAIKKRQQVSKKAVGVYDKKTQQLQRDLANV